MSEADEREAVWRLIETNRFRWTSPWPQVKRRSEEIIQREWGRDLILDLIQANQEVDFHLEVKRRHQKRRWE